MDIKEAIERLHKRVKANAFIVNTQCFVQHDIEAIETVLAELDELQKSVDQIYADYQDAGRRMFEYSDMVDEMAKEIFYKLSSDKFEYGYSESEVKEYFRKKVINEFNK